VSIILLSFILPAAGNHLVEKIIFAGKNNHPHRETVIKPEKRHQPTLYLGILP